VSQQRFRITNAPEAIPGCCFICSAASREFYVDLDIHMEFHGRMYFCNECLAEMARLCGFETPGKVGEMVAHKEHLEKQVFDLTVEKDALERVVDGYSRLRGVSNPVAASVPVMPGQLSLDTLSPESTEGGEESVGGGEGETPEPSNEQGMDDLRTSKPSEFTLEL